MSEPGIPATPFALADTILEGLENAAIGVTILYDKVESIERAYANHAAARIFGMTRDEFMQTPPMAPLDAIGRERTLSMREAYRRGEAIPTRFEARATRRDGSSIPIEVSLALSPSTDRLAIVLFYRDLSDRYRMEHAIRESEARFRKLAEVSPDTIVVISNGRMIYANPAAARVLGFTDADELIARPLSELVVSDEVPLMVDRMRRVMMGETFPPLEYRGRRKDGSIAVMEIFSIATHFDGRPAVAAFGRDVTERKALVAQLVQKDRLAAVGLLAAGIGHELNNPLTYVSLQLRRALAELDAAVGADAVRARIRGPIADALGGAEQIAAIVRELVSLSRDENVARAGVDIASVVASAIKVTLNTGSFDVAVVPDVRDVPDVETNAPRFAQVIGNVLNNALQASAEVGAKEVRVAVFAEGDRVVTEISDRGPGIRPDDLDRVMDPFFTTRPPGVGTGLGLTISYSIMQSLGGSISIRSEVGSGTTVRLELPIRAP
jgi:PAS domain S-box-containing protein